MDLIHVSSITWCWVVLPCVWWWFRHKVMSNSCYPMGCSLPGSSVHGVLQTRILEWVAISFSRGSSQHRDWTQVSCIAGRFFTDLATREAHYVFIYHLYIFFWNIYYLAYLNWAFLFFIYPIRFLLYMWFVNVACFSLFNNVLKTSETPTVLTAEVLNFAEN